MDDPFAILRIPSFTVRKESDLPKLKERAKNLVKQYEKVNKFDKAREVENAYRAVKEMVIKRANCAGSQAFNKVMVNRPAKSTSTKAKPEGKPQAAGPKNPAEVHFLKAQGASKAPAAAPAQPAEPYKSREERLREKLEARRAAASEKNKRAAAIKEKLAAKRAKKAGDAGDAGDARDAGDAGDAGDADAMASASSPAEASPLENMASPDSSGVDAEAGEEDPNPSDAPEDAGDVAVDFF